MAGIDSLSGYYGNNINTAMTNKAAEDRYKNSSMDAYGLDMSDFLSLMVAQFTNQGMENTADISDMLNQLVQMQMVTALASMSTTMETMTDHSIMTYAASLVGKEVTVAGYDEAGNYSELIGTVTATGSYEGEQVVFVNDKMFYMTQIIAVGRLPSTEAGNGATDGSEESGTDSSDSVSNTDTVDTRGLFPESGSIGGSGNTDDGGAVENSDGEN